MEQVNMEYSTKNIPLHSRKEFSLNLINKTRTFLRNLKWKAHFFLNPPKKANDINYYGFKSTKNAPPVNQIQAFEEDMIKMVQNVKFKKRTKFSSNFQKKLSSDIKTIKSCDKVLTKGDKTTNFYKTDKEAYQILMRNNVTKDYKKASQQDIDRVKNTDKKIAKTLKIDERVEIMPNSESYIHLKDHKEDFLNRKQCRLVNPIRLMFS